MGQQEEIILIYKKALKKQRESCLICATIESEHNGDSLIVYIDRNSILNAPESEDL